MPDHSQATTIVCVDVGYDDVTARAACVVMDHFSDALPVAEYVVEIDEVNAYIPGEFFRRELPCIHEVLKRLDRKPTCVVVDGYVWLDADNRPGLGAYLYDSLGQIVPVIGVAKNAFKGSNHAAELRRGTSDRPLYITSVGLPLTDAVERIKDMHGESRMPTILKRVDRLSRGGEPRIF